jgi:hypothetical protein
MIYSIEVAAEPPDRDLLPAGGLRGGVAGRLPPGRRRAAAAMPARDRGVGGVAPTRPEPAVRGRRLAGREWLRFLSRGRQSRPGDQPVAPPPEDASIRSSTRSMLVWVLVVVGFGPTALFELCDTTLCAQGQVGSIPAWSLESEFTRSHGSLYKAQSRDLRRGLPPTPDRLCPDSTLTAFPSRPTPPCGHAAIETSPERGFYHSSSRHPAGQPIAAGWSYQALRLSSRSM